MSSRCQMSHRCQMSRHIGNGDRRYQCPFGDAKRHDLFAMWQVVIGSGPFERMGVTWLDLRTDASNRQNERWPGCFHVVRSGDSSLVVPPSRPSGGHYIYNVACIQISAPPFCCRDSARIVPCSRYSSPLSFFLGVPSFSSEGLHRLHRLLLCLLTVSSFFFISYLLF